QFNNPEKTCKGDFATVYSAIWKDGPLCYDENKKEYLRESDKKIALNCISQNLIDFLNEVLYIQYEIIMNLIYLFITSLYLYFNRLIAHLMQHTQFICMIIFLKYMEYLKTQNQMITLWLLKMYIAVEAKKLIASFKK